MTDYDKQIMINELKKVQQGLDRYYITTDDLRAALYKICQQFIFLIGSDD